jgi:hypothetical protein
MKKDVEKSGSGLLKDTIQEFDSEDWGKSITIAYPGTEVRSTAFQAESGFAVHCAAIYGLLKMREFSACCVLVACCVHDILFDSEIGGNIFLRNIIILHGVTSQKKIPFIVTAVRTSNPVYRNTPKFHSFGTRMSLALQVKTTHR